MLSYIRLAGEMVSEGIDATRPWCVMCGSGTVCPLDWLALNGQEFKWSCRSFTNERRLDGVAGCIDGAKARPSIKPLATARPRKETFWH